MVVAEARRPAGLVRGSREEDGIIISTRPYGFLWRIYSFILRVMGGDEKGGALTLLPGAPIGRRRRSDHVRKHDERIARC